VVASQELGRSPKGVKEFRPGSRTYDAFPAPAFCVYILGDPSGTTPTQSAPDNRL